MVQCSATAIPVLMPDDYRFYAVFYRTRLMLLLLLRPQERLRSIAMNEHVCVSVCL